MNSLLKLLQKSGHKGITLRSAAAAAISLLWVTAATASPIVESVTTTYDSNNLYISTLFAPGSLDPLNYQLSLYIDADQNVATGVAGAEYSIYLSQFGSGWSAATAFQGPTSSFSTPFVLPSAMLTEPNFGAFLSMISSVNVSTDAINLSAPLSLFANDDGNVNISAYASTAPSVTIGFGDLFGTVITWDGFTVLTVPEPSSALLLLLGLTFLFAVRNRSRHI